MGKMTWADAKSTIYGIIEEYNETAANLTDDDDIAARIPVVFNTAYQEMSQIKKILKTTSLDRSGNGTTTLYREYDLPTDLYQIKSISFVSETTEEPLSGGEFFFRGSDKIVVNDTEDGKVYIEYYAFPTVINSDIEDTFELEIDNDATIIACYTAAGDILKTDVSANYVAFERERDRRLSLFNTSRQDNVIGFGKRINLN